VGEARPTIDLPRPWVVDLGYLLSSCECYRVESGSVHVGTVENVVYSSHSGRPDHLLVRAGRFERPRLRTVSLEEIDAVLPDEERIVLREPASAAALAEPVRTPWRLPGLRSSRT
jgi:hypothetical protein